MLLLVLSYIPAILLSWLIGLLTLLKNPRAKPNIYFGVATFSLGLWLSMLFLGDFTTDPTIALWAVRLATLFGTPMIASIIFFSTVFPEILREPSKRFNRVNLIFPMIFMILALTPFLVPSVIIRDNSAQPTNLGILYSLQSIYAIGGFIYAAIIILRKYSHVGVRAKSQVRLVGLGLLIAVLVNALTGGVLTLLNISNNYSNLVGSISFLIFISITSYAIVRHHLFDIRLAIARTVGFILTIGLVGTIYSLIVLGISTLFISPDQAILSSGLSVLFVLIPPTIFVGLTFHSIQTRIARATRRIFYHDTYDLKTALDSISDTLITDSNIDKIMSQSLRLINESIKPTYAHFTVFGTKGKPYRELSVRSKVSEKTILALSKFIKKVSSNPINRDDSFDEELPKYFERDDIALLLRLGTEENMVGLLIFGAKQNGRSYTADDVALLRISAKNLAIALENAKKYDQISKFADTMQREVHSATTKLRQANEELKTLDVLKDDFISMASHQLRTPATSVYEALQMLNHPNTSSKLAKKEQSDLLELAGASSEHLVTVIAEMLSISSIQAGRFNINKTPLVLQELVERVIKQTSAQADQKQIKLVFEKPAQPLKIKADQAKIVEVVSNYLENAIKYSTQKSTVTIKLRVSNGRVRFEVEDQGMGVPEKERKNLFSKFFRASNARKKQLDGSGIGLFVVKTIATSHGGDAYYKPLSGGSLFGIWLPL